MWSLIPKKRFLMSSPILIHSVFLLSIVSSYHFSNTELQKQVNTEQIIATSTTLSKLFYDSGLSVGAYGLTKNQTFIDRYQKLVNQISPTIETLHKLVNQQPVKEISFQEINQTAQQTLEQLKDAKTVLRDSNLSPLNDNQGEIHNLYKQIKSSADQLQSKLDQLSLAEQELSKSSLSYRSIYQLLLALTFFCYVGLNLTMQQKIHENAGLF